jgi:alpha-L-rhamnosidase
LAVLAISLGSVTGGFAMDVRGLTCEYLKNPRGIDVEQPRLSWQLEAPAKARGKRQTAYEIKVASSEDLLVKDKGDLWESGVITSNQSALVPYAGKKLESQQACFWKVRVTDEAGRISAWSKPARFSMGLLNAEDWQGDWIWYPSDKTTLDHMWFRKSLVLDETIAKAKVYLASIGYHELYVNGQKADDRVLAPALTRLDKRVLYITYDIKPLLKKGDNVIAVWAGAGWARYPNFKTTPALRVQGHLVDRKGKSTTLVSDSGWKCSISSSAYTGSWNFGNMGGEVAEMGRANDEWNHVGFDDSKWRPARIVSKHVTLSAQMVEPDRVIETLSPVSIRGTAPCFIDMGKNFTGQLEIRLRPGVGSKRVDIHTADEDYHKKNRAAADFGQRSRLNCNPDGSGLFQHRMNIVAGRYTGILGLKEPLQKDDIRAYAVSTDLKRVGHFSCSKELFNRIYEADLWTFRANTLNGYTMDCPHRERLGYGEIPFATSWGIGLPNYKIGAFYTKFARDWGDVQEENGWIDHTAPQNSGLYGGPMWSSAPINLSWEVYKYNGDTNILKNTYPVAQRWLRFLAAHVKDGILQNYASHHGRFLGDWAAPRGRKEYGGTRESLFFNNCTYVMVLNKVISMAKTLGNDDDAGMYEKQLASLQRRIHEEFYDKEKNYYLKGWQVHQAFPLLVGVVPEHLRDKVYSQFIKEITVNKPYLDMGSSGLPVLLAYLIEDAERNDILYTHLSNENHPGYGYFLAKDQSTWPEYWAVRNVHSKIHTCYTGISGYFTKGIAGIRHDPEAPGFQKFIIKPHPVGDLTWAKASSPTLYGTVVSDWRLGKDVFTLRVEVPVNSSATVYLPAQAADTVTEGSGPASKAEGVRFLEMEDGRALFEVGSGNYTFKSNL